MKFFEVLLPIMVQIGAVLGGLALTALAVYARDYLRQKVGHEKLEVILKKAEVLVKWAEQTMDKLPGFQKKEVVMIALRALAEAIGYFLDDAELDQIIEAEVFKMNAAKAA